MARSDQVSYFHEETERKLGFARCVRSGAFLFVSGCASTDDQGTVVGKGDMATQIKTVYRQIQTILASQHLTLEHVIKEVLYTTNMGEFVGAAAVRAAFYNGVAPPAATGVEVTALVHPDMLVEIEVIAEIPAHRA